MCFRYEYYLLYKLKFLIGMLILQWSISSVEGANKRAKIFIEGKLNVGTVEDTCIGSLLLIRY